MSESRECSPPRAVGAHEIPLLICEDKPLYPLTGPPGNQGPVPARSPRAKKTPAKNLNEFGHEQNGGPSVHGAPGASNVSGFSTPSAKVSCGRKWQRNDLQFRANEDSHYNLPDGWKKIVTTRKSGATAGCFDVYLCPPGMRRLRSNNDIVRFVHQNPTFPLDPNFVNMELPLSPSGRTEDTEKVRRLKELLDEVRRTGTIPGKMVFTPAAGNKKKHKMYARKGTTQVGSGSGGGKKSPRIKETHWNNFTKDKIMRLERLFVSNVGVPSQSQVQTWSSSLNLHPADVTRWFQQKWQSKLEYEAAEFAAAAIDRLNAKKEDRSEDAVLDMLEPEVIIQDGDVDDRHEEVLELDENGKLVAEYRMDADFVSDVEDYREGPLRRTRKPVKFDIDTCGNAGPPVDEEYVIEYAQDEDEVEVAVDATCDEDDDVIEIVEDDIQMSE